MCNCRSSPSWWFLYFRWCWRGDFLMIPRQHLSYRGWHHWMQCKNFRLPMLLPTSVYVTFTISLVMPVKWQMTHMVLVFGSSTNCHVVWHAVKKCTRHKSQAQLCPYHSCIFWLLLCIPLCWERKHLQRVNVLIELHPDAPGMESWVTKTFELPVFLQSSFCWGHFIAISVTNLNAVGGKQHVSAAWELCQALSYNSWPSLPWFLPDSVYWDLGMLRKAKCWNNHKDWVLLWRPQSSPFFWLQFWLLQTL